MVDDAEVEAVSSVVVALVTVDDEDAPVRAEEHPATATTTSADSPTRRSVRNRPPDTVTHSVSSQPATQDDKAPCP